ncbi:MAG: bifunctional phosphopantothenoylcysteine decarboxylase/phosphopantothenate--cysteine ligase CoaBC [Candidatus Magnetominusculus sp. LBB02]|nr:bifunctional phosphopantothenoylcysteine decarboxylase/phosphopantothenate--cysteine ligase CoaBC [Candidatus Magnetominusculus sp. LBB02]
MEGKARGRPDAANDAARYVVLGVTGSVAAYKSPLIVRAIKDSGMGVRVVMTEAATRFVTPLALELVSENPVLWDNFQSPLSHIGVAKDALAMVIAPATLNTISKCSSAIADNLLTTMFMAFNGPVIIAPAMNYRMYGNPIFKDRLSYLKDKGVIEVAPEAGQLACGEEGVGRMASEKRIVNALRRALGANDMNGLRVVVTSGPTREYLDPVRFITNMSSGKMGAALARAAYFRGASVTLISGPSSQPVTDGIEVIQVETSDQMQTAVLAQSKEADIVVMAAAVCDFKPERLSSEKLTRSENFTLSLIKTTDILHEVSERRHTAKTPYICGFAAETGDRKDLRRALGANDMNGLRVVVTSGPTREYLDPVRFITNMSSGKMGAALARAAYFRGASVTLISGPSSQPVTDGIEVIQVETSDQMQTAVLAQSKEADIVVMAAAVCDFKPERLSSEKLTRSENFTLSLIKTTDILHEVSERRHTAKTPYICGFAAETGDRKDLRRALGANDMNGLRVVVTSGPTREYLDPVRFITNMSSGKMGAALARAAYFRGASVTLISGPSSQPVTDGIEVIQVETSDQMQTAVLAQSKEADIVVMAAAVCDFKPERLSSEKLTRSENFTLSLIKTTDILHEVSERRHTAKTPYICGFAAETGDRKDLRRALGANDMNGLRVVVTSGPTREYLDPVRFITNMSSGKMGAALARAAYFRGASVTLISGPSSQPVTDGIEVIQVETSDQMQTAVLAQSKEADIVVMAAAVCDFKPERLSSEKLTRSENFTLSLIKTTDILHEVSERRHTAKTPYICGFAAETGDRKDLRRALGANDMNGLRVVVTSGPTREYLDPVRFITNMSSGKMGAALARAAYFRGASVTLISGPSSQPVTDGIEVIQVETSDQMQTAVLAQSKEADIVVMAAAVCDFKPERLSSEKLTRSENFTLSLIKTTDILHEVSERRHTAKTPYICGFAAETGDRKDLRRALGANDMNGLRVVVTSGPTREYLDPVRFITNMSSGKMGAALARAAYFRGASVTLISGPSSQPVTDGIEVIQVETSDQMQTAVLAQSKEADIVVMAAAVCDFKPERLSSEKLTRSENFTLSLIKTTDILHEVSERRHTAKTPYICGFAAETGDRKDLRRALGANDMNGLRVVVTSGPTREYLDPVRFITNMSSGKMGAALARAAYFRGASVTLISGPSSQPVTDGIEVIQVETSDQMQTAVLAQSKEADIVVMAAAVCDFKPERLSSEKLTRSENFTLSLIKTTDILHEVSERRHTAKTPYICGFAAETGDRKDLRRALGANDMNGLRVVVTSGPTREYLDPVRFITNMSSGKMGAALARAAYFRGASVTLISGPSSQPVTDGIEVIQVETSDQMQTAVLAQSKEADIVVMAAAVCDFKPERLSSEKLTRSENFTLSLIKTTDILHEVSERRHTAKTPYICGFAAETGDRKDLRRALGANDMNGLRVVVTSGPTREYLDPVRFITNMSSGKMGAALARAAYFRGASVTLISGPSSQPVTDGIEVIQVETSDQMQTAVLAQSKEADIVVMAAAVCDFKPERLSSEKLTRSENFTLSLIKTTDILHEVSERRHTAKTPYICGFAAETGDRKDLRRALGANDMNGLRVVVTSGPTREYLDPVRFITNMSSGKMGAALARAAYFRGASVTLISGPSSQPVTDGIEVIQVETSDQMQTAVLAQSKEADIVVMAAAVCDFKPERLSSEKLTRSENFTLSLIKTTDILHEVSERRHTAKTPYICGFAAETGDRKDLRRALGANDMNGLRVVVTSGPTREYLDPVRFITNMSSGKMGAALARAAYFRGASVTLISGPSSQPVTDGIEVIQVETSDQMQTAVLAQSKEADIVVMAAAVCDFKPERLSSEKLTRSENFTLSLIKTTDILHEVSERRHTAKTPYICGFAAETGDRKDRAREKLKRKGIDMIVFNDVTANGAGFDKDTNIMSIITQTDELPIPKMSKELGANIIFDNILLQIKGTF